MRIVVEIGRITQLWRYPVKSMRGEECVDAALNPEGLAGDRRYAIVSDAAPPGAPLLSGAERAAMLRYAPRLSPEAEVVTPEGTRLGLDSEDLLTELQTRTAAQGARLHMLRSPGRPLTDVRPLSLISVQTLRALSAEMGQNIDPQRFRSNIVLTLSSEEPFGEKNFSGATLHFGEGHEAAVVRVLERIPRCRMVALDPATAAEDRTILRHLAQHHQGRTGVYARVLRPGMIRVGDVIFRL